MATHTYFGLAPTVQSTGNVNSNMCLKKWKILQNGVDILEGAEITYNLQGANSGTGKGQTHLSMGEIGYSRPRRRRSKL